jgi:hypothetical protein
MWTSTAADLSIRYPIDEMNECKRGHYLFDDGHIMRLQKASDNKEFRVLDFREAEFEWASIYRREHGRYSFESMDRQWIVGDIME